MAVDSGYMLTDKQVRRYREKLAKPGMTRQAAADAAGISVKAARKWEDSPLPSQTVKPVRDWRTRPDPLQGVWAEKIVPLLEADKAGALQATTVLGVIQAHKPDTYDDGLLRTVQRRIRDWRAHSGPGKEVMFEQDYPPGGYAQSDFTHCDELGITIRGEAFPHLIYELRLCYSRRRAISLALGETYEALTFGTQEAFFEFGGVSHHLQTDNLSAATQELNDGRRFTKRYSAFMEHFKCTPRRIKPGESHQNGGTERDHQTLKNALAQALILRDSTDFRSVDEYWAFVVEVKDQLNAKCAKAFAEERAFLKPLPSSRVPCYTDTVVRVRSTSCIQVRNNTYSVPSRLIGHEVVARVHPNTVDVMLGGKVLETYPRLRGRGKYRIDYRHIVHSLVRKTGAFAHYRYREELFPTLTFRQAYDALVEWRGNRADLEYVRILNLAATTMESLVDAVLTTLLFSGKPFDFMVVERMVKPALEPTVVTDLEPFKPDLKAYDSLLEREEAA
jgi:hypothetical protein